MAVIAIWAFFAKVEEAGQIASHHDLDLQKGWQMPLLEIGMYYIEASEATWNEQRTNIYFISCDVFNLSRRYAPMYIA